MLSLFFSAFILGIIFNAAPGAVFAETVRQGARGGYSAALAVQFGSLVGDSTWALLGLAGIGLLLQLDGLRVPIGVAGVLYLLYLSWDSWKSAKVEFTVAPRDDVNRSALRAGVLLSVTNPQNVAFIAALGSAMGAVGVHAPTGTDYAVFFAGLMSASFLWCFVCAWIVARIFQRTNQRWTTLTYQLCALAFFALAVASFRDLLTSTSTAAPTKTAVTSLAPVNR
ncbi:MAG: chemotaxis protein [Betaproteobacteria bacterium]|nr:MAG: chemotaxis protein [Betaproteobacteria bacterium]